MNAESQEPRIDVSLHAEMPEGEEKAPKGVRIMAWLRWLLLALALGLAVYTNVTYFGSDAGQVTGAPTLYCPMHPEIVSDKPGSCPICHMSLEPIPEDRLSPSSEHAHHGHEHAHEGEALPPGTAPVTLGFDRVQAIGVRTARVTKQEVNASLKVTATITAPEQGQAFVHTRAAGYVERASVQQTGVRVRRGQELVALYSPEIYQAQAELLAARSWKGEGGVSKQAEAARTKLELLGVSSKAIDRILESGKPSRTVPITSPVDGWVVKKNAALGSYVTPELTLFEIVDLSQVYVTAEVFQRDASRVGVGTKARFVPTAREGRAIEGTIDLVYPTLSPKERTIRVRMQVKNRDGELRPGDYGLLELASESRDSVVVPRDAIVDTGSVAYVFVVEEGGRFVPRTVTLGGDFDGFVEVKGGVHEGEEVVSSATFLIDSESRLQASLAGHRGAPTSHAGHAH